MAVRVTHAEVSLIFDTALASTNIEAFIVAANDLVNNVLGSTALTATTLALVEKFLAAHFCALKDPRARGKGTGKSNVSYEGKFGFGTGIKSTQYGQTACELDWTGTLSTWADTKGKATPMLELI